MGLDSRKAPMMMAFSGCGGDRYFDIFLQQSEEESPSRKSHKTRDHIELRDNGSISFGTRLS
jgi:hypothetical protein